MSHDAGVGCPVALSANAMVEDHTGPIARMHVLKQRPMTLKALSTRRRQPHRHRGSGMLVSKEGSMSPVGLAEQAHKERRIKGKPLLSGHHP